MGENGGERKINPSANPDIRSQISPKFGEFVKFIRKHFESGPVAQVMSFEPRHVISNNVAF